MWHRIAQLILQWRWYCFALILLFFLVQSWIASQVQLTYNFAKAIPTNHQKYIEYTKFLSLFGDDGKMIFIGVSDTQWNSKSFLNTWHSLADSLKHIKGIESVMSITHSFDLEKDTVAKKLLAKPLGNFPLEDSSLQAYLQKLESLPFYKGLLYNPSNNAMLMAVGLDKKVLDSKQRGVLISDIENIVRSYEKRLNTSLKVSGLPYARTSLLRLVRSEMIFFTLLSIIVSLLVLYLFFRSWNILLISMLLIAIGIVSTLATIVLLGYKITLLTGLIPSLVVVITIPNIIFLVNKFHHGMSEGLQKHDALHNAISHIGLVTLFTNLTAAVGFGVFAFTQSVLLREFGIVASINILLLFVLSLIWVPIGLLFFKTNLENETHYMRWSWTKRLTQWLVYTTQHRSKWIYTIAVFILAISVFGLIRIDANSYMLDDVPKRSKLYADLTWFEKSFGGVMPFEILIDTKKSNRVMQAKVFDNIEKLNQLLQTYPVFNKSLHIAEGLKFATQSYYEHDTTQYRLPSSALEQSFIFSYIGGKDSTKNQSQALLESYVDSSKQYTRVSAPIADIGSDSLEKIFSELQPKIANIFDSNQYKVSMTGTSVVFLEGNKYIINGMKESVIFAFFSILVCMFLLFRSPRLVVISMLPNIIPLLLVGGLLGLLRIPIKPSSVLVFGIALGISIDVTIRFLVFYKYAKNKEKHSENIITSTIGEATLSVVHTSIILISGFLIYSFSSFGGTKALGLLTSLALLLCTISNLTFLPALLHKFDNNNKKEKL